MRRWRPRRRHQSETCKSVQRSELQKASRCAMGFRRAPDLTMPRAITRSLRRTPLRPQGGQGFTGLQQTQWFAAFWGSGVVDEPMCSASLVQAPTPCEPHRSVPIRPPIRCKTRTDPPIYEKNMFSAWIFVIFTDRWARPIFYNGSVDGSARIGGFRCPLAFCGAARLGRSFAGSAFAVRASLRPTRASDDANRGLPVQP